LFTTGEKVLLVSLVEMIIWDGEVDQIRTGAPTVQTLVGGPHDITLSGYQVPRMEQIFMHKAYPECIVSTAQLTLNVNLTCRDWWQRLLRNQGTYH